MKPTNHITFKEWAVVCEALAAGAQTLFLRKGGINEGRDGFRISHGEFWLYPTQFHQGTDALTSSAMPYWERVRDHPPLENRVSIRLYAEVADVYEVTDLDHLLPLKGHHILADETVEQRFYYRQPGLFVIVARIYRLPSPVVVTETTTMAGCKSWVEMPAELSTDELTPVLGEEAFSARRKVVESLLV
ncbi:MAG: DUF1802 family protein [Planctomycetota bacterium]|nr:DUF1802 family protein [Planctomycetota bacterium]MDA1214116.1 DUF1802 family protein [Planctomycetota bacterium]